MASPTSTVERLEEAQGEEVVSFVKDLYKREKDRKRPYSMQHYLNLAFYLGHQHVHLSTLGTLVRDLDEPDEVLATRNLILPRVDRIVSKATQDPPIAEAIAPTDDEDAKNAADTATELLDHHYYSQRQQAKDEIVLKWAEICGKGFYKTFWNARAGGYLKVPVTEAQIVPQTGEDGMPVIGPDGQPAFTVDNVPVMNKDGSPKTEIIALGDIHTEAVSPFEVYPIGDGTSVYDDGISAILHVTKRDKKYVGAVYGVDTYNIETTEQRDTGDIYRDMAEQLGTILGGHDVAKDKQTKSGVLVFEYWEKPCVERPEGRWIVVCGDKLVKDEDLPYEDSDGSRQWIPFDEVHGGKVVPGRFWPTSPVEQSIELQREYNRLASKIQEHTDVSVDGKIIRVAGDGIEDDQWIGRPGEIMKVTSAAHKPDVWYPPQLSPDVRMAMEDITAQVDDLFGVHEASRAQLPGGDKVSGVTVAYLQEQDETVQGPMYRSYHRARESVGQKTVMLAQQFYDETRKVKIIGRNKRWQVKDFDAADIAAITDVRIRQSSAGPRSRVGATQLIFQILERAPQLYTDPQTGQFDVMRLAEDLQVGDSAAMWDAVDHDVDQARRENERMQNGQPPNPLSTIDPTIPNQYDNHLIHYKEHSRYMKTGEFEMLPLAIRQIYSKHLEAHSKVLASMGPKKANGGER